MSRVNRRMCILMVKFCRSTLHLETCVRSGLPSKEHLLRPGALGGAVPARKAWRSAVDLHKLRIIHITGEGAFDGVEVGASPSVVSCTRMASRFATSSMNIMAQSPSQPPTKCDTVSLYSRRLPSR